ncbi:Glycosyltransferase involved in cell wall bisynthesis [Pedobacter suwonensis]|uniref:Glycosyltransferase involved in cell wall bisynthesis n=1 Tax=Pedobacter suwonensis TaxID=332999 RepID=A0A1I0SU05_9SPHI|nr:hypothetical protein [Pedobacter suwonensis]SFA42246.1 Glycosyltransferase involved in cell wall bisynthesis [Pedobacter suwonensis]
MIYIIEAFVEDYLHVLANVNIIKIFRNIYTDKPIVFTSPKKHNEQVKECFKSADPLISFESVPNLNVATTNIFNRVYLILLRIQRDISLLNKVFKKCKPGDIVVVTHIYFPCLVLLKLIKKKYPLVTTLSVIHGDVEYVYYPKTKQQKIVGFFHKLMFKIKAKQFYYIFLTPISKQILLETKKTTHAETLAIELPPFPNDHSFKDSLTLPRDVLKIGHVGSAGVRKNVHLFYELAVKLKVEIEGGTLQLSNVGVLETSIEPFLSPLIIDFVNQTIDKPLSREKYNEKISDLHYAIFFYGKDDFILRSSAAFFDAIFYEKPLIVLKNTFFEDVFKREGEIGYLCENLEEMAILINQLLTQQRYHEEKYVLMVENIRKYKSKLTIDIISSDLKNGMESLGIICPATS